MYVCMYVDTIVLVPQWGMYLDTIVLVPQWGMYIYTPLYETQ